MLMEVLLVLKVFPLILVGLEAVIMKFSHAWR